MTRNENITRLAARAVDFQLSPGWAWIDDGEHVGFFECFGGDIDLKVGFAPLSAPADAYRMEDKLRMEVTYRVMAQAANGGQALVISVRTHGHGGAVMHTVPHHHSSLKGRMFAVTQFAALNCLMDDKDDPVARPLSAEIRNG